jgi:tRNA wybutosine-synthesizing protein 2
MDSTVKKWLASFSATPSPPDTNRIVKAFSRYTLYTNMLLLPADAITIDGPLWRELDWIPTSSEFNCLLASMASRMKVTHIAANKPIPPRNRLGSAQFELESPHMESNDPAEETEPEDENILRAPHDFTPLYGDFGPMPTTPLANSPTRADFDAAFWALARQNGIWQVWAPRWTMFSRGNISEKARLLQLASVQKAIKDGKQHDGHESRIPGCGVVDLFAGIGYFAFSYIKAGADIVVCWDLNPWSVEGLRRGAVKNKWRVRICAEAPETQESGEAARTASIGPNETRTTSALASLTAEHPGAERPNFLVFPENNNRAPARIAALRAHLPPIRHVNCGMLPSSRASLAIAAQVLDPILGGWVHVHENVAEKDVAAKAEETRSEFERAWVEVQVGRARGERSRSALCEHVDDGFAPETSLSTAVALEHVYKLKNFAPRVVHIVIDLYVPPPSSLEENVSQSGGST